jgi:thiol-disulfide isomerase/thioredoxin
MTRRQLLALAVTALLAVGAGAWLAWHRLTPSQPTRAEAAALFAHAFADAQGQMQPIAQWRGKLLVVNFWATWCPPCVEEMPDLQRIRDQYRDRNVEVIGIGIDTADKIRAFQAQHQLTLPLLVAGAGGSDLGRALGNQIGALPYTVLLSPDGDVVQRKLGQIRPSELTAWLDAQLRP